MVKLFSILFILLLALYPCALTAQDSVLKLPSDYKNLPDAQKWKVKPIAYYPAGENRRVIAFLLDKDNELGLNFISYMKSEASGKWDGCSPFIINAMSKGKAVFLDDEVVLNLMSSVQNYADALCPNADKILFFASPKPFGMSGVDMPLTSKTDENITFAAKLDRNEDGSWGFSPDNVINRVQNYQEDKEKLYDNLNYVYQNLQHYTFSQKAAFLFDAEDLDNPLLMLTAADIANEPAPTVFIFHIRQFENNKGWIDEPFPIMLKDESGSIAKEGWYIGSGLLYPLNTKEKMKAGIKKNAPAGLLEINDAFACQNKNCEEINDTIALIQKKYKIYDWKPYK